MGPNSPGISGAGNGAIVSHWGGQGTESGFNKLTEESVAQIKFDLAVGESVAVVAHRYGVSKSAIYAIKAGKTWTHVKVPAEIPR